MLLRAVMHRTGCSMHYAPLCVELSDVTAQPDWAAEVTTGS
jgi:hypothetical protein